MLQVNDKKKFKFRERIRACNKCGETFYHESMERKYQKQRDLLDADFRRNHKNCNGIQCKNCKLMFLNIEKYNRHLNQCNYVYQLELDDAKFHFKRQRIKYFTRASD